jgi:2-oxoglutarate ferredoxin oxidoreductase subunit gamma
VDQNGDDKGLSVGPIKGLKMTTDGFCEEVIIAGFGGQGIILAGKLLAQTAMKAGRQVTYMPSYGAEVRGGTANCMVVVADGPIANPVVTKPNSLIAMNKASLNKFGPRIKPGGLLVMNTSLIDTEPDLDGTIEVVAIPIDDLAGELGSPRSANMVAMGAYLQKRGYMSPDAAAASLAEVLAKRYHQTLPVNTEALHRGAKFAANDS